MLRLEVFYWQYLSYQSISPFWTFLQKKYFRMCIKYRKICSTRFFRYKNEFGRDSNDFCRIRFGNHLLRANTKILGRPWHLIHILGYFYSKNVQNQTICKDEHSDVIFSKTLVVEPVPAHQNTSGKIWLQLKKDRLPKARSTRVDSSQISTRKNLKNWHFSSRPTWKQNESIQIRSRPF